MTMRKVVSKARRESRAHGDVSLIFAHISWKRSSVSL